MRGLFIVLEGLDGAGKTTIAKLLCESLGGRGYKTLYTYEPTDSEVVRVVKSNYSQVRDPYIDALTFALDRLLHTKAKIKPALEQGYVVISDRYYYSSVAYQGAGGADPQWVLEVNKYALKPDLAFYIDIDPETALQRKRGQISRFPEFEELEYLARVRNIYLRLVEAGLLISVDGRKALKDVYADIEQAVMKTLLERLGRQS